jgi:tetratricopeptide (TPR) repeat protein
LDLEPRNVLVLTNLARLQFGSDQDTDAAWATLRQAELALGLTDSARSLDERTTQAAEIENLRGFLLLARSDTAAAIAAFERASRLNTRLGEPHLGLGIAYMRQGREDDALRALATAVLLEPRRSLFYSYWGKMLHQLRRFDKALEVLARAKRYDKNDPTPLLYEALVLRDLNRPVESIKALQTAIERNDFRGVFRSRFLLDQDLAVKNVDLSRLFSELGLNAWAQQKAVAAVDQDYTNYSAHIMLSGSLAGRGRTFSEASENLFSRMVAPASVNSFNSFNNYTILFEQPDLGGTISITGGDRDRAGGVVRAEGAIPSWNLAVGALADYSDYDGWRNTNSENARDVAFAAKWDFSPQDSFLLTASRRSERIDDKLFPRYEDDFPAEPLDRFEPSLTRLELGYRHSFGRGKDLLLLISRLDRRRYLIENDRLELLLPPDSLTLESRLESDINQPSTQAQAQFMTVWDTDGWGVHQIILGTTGYWIDDALERTNALSLTFDGQSVPLFAVPLSNDIDRRFHSHYLLDKWRISETWSLEAGVYLDRFRNGDIERGTNWKVDKVNPRLGAVWRFSSADTLRIAAFRYLLPSLAGRLDPTFLVGIPLLRDEGAGSLESGLHLLWEHEWDLGFLSADLFAREREVDVDLGSGAGPPELETFRARRHGLEVNWNQLIRGSSGLAFVYRYLSTRDQLNPETDREEHFASGAIRYLAPSGLFGSLIQTFRHVRSVDEQRPREDIFITDLNLGYRLPNRRGELQIGVGNLFNASFNWVTDRFDVFSGRAPRRQFLATLSLNF